MTTPSTAALSEVSDSLRGSWHRFLNAYEPIRPELYRRCRDLTRSPWGAEDLAQDALARAGTLIVRLSPQERHAHEDGREAVRAISRFELEGDRVSRVQNYFFTPDALADLCGELGVPFRSNGYRCCSSGG